jgi:acetyl-CoA/propionyl-CoA carboxylase biotin carboxyl carrier protein
MVAWQLRIAAGERLPASVSEVRPRGHAIEVRLYAEDPYDDFRPMSGAVGAWRMPDGPGVRVDAGVLADTELPSQYDPLLAKLLVHADDRPAAVSRLRRALDETLIGGVQTDLGFHRWIVDQPSFVSGDYDTGLIEREWGSGPPIPDADARLAAAAATAARRFTRMGAGPGLRPDRVESAWGRLARREAIR